ncbi:hypothetical protein PGT21_027799 [Puccinia graminis f. sp. tritici]|uniref:Uncharacterized protein n=1 Tax=Puccinia graminis f. sp. tritici TaxID=56615 RepID=A0A5B0PV00_PUCGR|nr:hypothetical protein PGT21_027799 [Puccinia graminis f. sp. tritici]
MAAQRVISLKPESGSCENARFRKDERDTNSLGGSNGTSTQLAKRRNPTSSSHLHFPKKRTYIGLMAVLALMIALDSSPVAALTPQTCATHFFADPKTRPFAACGDAKGVDHPCHFDDCYDPQSGAKYEEFRFRKCYNDRVREYPTEVAPIQYYQYHKYGYVAVQSRANGHWYNCDYSANEVNSHVLYGSRSCQGIATLLLDLAKHLG